MTTIFIGSLNQILWHPKYNAYDISWSYIRTLNPSQLEPGKDKKSKSSEIIMDRQNQTSEWR